jgi:hypothetical protein
MHDLTTPRQSDAWMDIVTPDRVRQRELAGDEFLFHQDDPVMALYRLETGRIRLVRHLEDGTTVSAAPGQITSGSSQRNRRTYGSLGDEKLLVERTWRAANQNPKTAKTPSAERADRLGMPLNLHASR